MDNVWICDHCHRTNRAIHSVCYFCSTEHDREEVIPEEELSPNFFDHGKSKLIARASELLLAAESYRLAVYSGSDHINERETLLRIARSG